MMWTPRMFADGIIASRTDHSGTRAPVQQAAKAASSLAFSRTSVRNRRCRLIPFGYPREQSRPEWNSVDRSAGRRATLLPRSPCQRRDIAIYLPD